MKNSELPPPQWSIKKVNRKDLKPFKGNPRTISPEDFEAEAREFFQKLSAKRAKRLDKKVSK